MAASGLPRGLKCKINVMLNLLTNCLVEKPGAQHRQSKPPLVSTTKPLYLPPSVSPIYFVTLQVCTLLQLAGISKNSQGKVDTRVGRFTGLFAE
jgi:hypothetical protein